MAYYVQCLSIKKWLSRIWVFVEIWKKYIFSCLNQVDKIKDITIHLPCWCPFLFLIPTLPAQPTKRFHLHVLCADNVT